MGFTNEQMQAITERGTNILVSAGAGSGKTAVLSERILSHLKEGVDLDQLIVLTFTKAAAAEMKERIEQKIKDEVMAGNKALEPQLEKISTANITNFDSFTQNFVKRYHYLLGVESQLSIIDKQIVHEKLSEYIDTYLKNGIEANNQELIWLIEQYAVSYNDYEKLVQLLVELYPKFADYRAANHDFKFQIELDHFKQQFVQMINEIIKRMNDEIKKIHESCTEEIALKHAEGVSERYAIIQEVTSISSFQAMIDEYVYQREIKKNYPAISKALSEETLAFFTKQKELLDKKLMADLLKYSTMLKGVSIESQIEFHHKINEVLIDLYLNVEKQLLEFKHANSSFEFIDFSVMLIKVLEDYPDIRNELRSNLVEIMVDEYQDTNDIQEKIISLLANNNFFCVGDQKQAIYRFRGGNPDLIDAKYQAYSATSSENSQVNGKNIDLNKNFRSKEDVLTQINLVFENIMSKEYGGVEYNASQRLNFGNDKLSLSGQSKMEVCFVPSDYKDQGFKERHLYEAAIIAKDIKAKIASSKVVQDDSLRQPVYSDFAILTGSKATYNDIKKVFEYYQIPLVSGNAEPFKVAQEFIVFKNLLMLLEILFNHEHKNEDKLFGLVVIARSYLFRLSDQVIQDAVLFIRSKSNFHEAVQESSFKEIYHLIKNIKAENTFVNLQTISLEIINEFNLIGKLILLENPVVAEQRLNYLVKLMSNFDNLNYSLAQVVDYFEKIYAGDEKIDIEFEQILNIDVDAVKIMTIHKSKGLQFKYCYIIEMNKQFNRSHTLHELSPKIIFTKQQMFVADMRNEFLFKPLLKELHGRADFKEAISEKIRLFYVALTRAEEKLIFFVDQLVDKKGNEKKTPALDVQSFNCFADMLVPLLPQLEKQLDLISYEIPEDEINDIGRGISNKMNERNPKYESVVEYRELETKLKTTTSSRASMHNFELTNSEEQYVLAKGNELHELIEMTDFNLIASGETVIPVELTKLVELFRENQLLDPSFNYYHEYQFNYQIGTETKNGIIDLLVHDTNTNKYYIIDFKLSKIDKPEYELQLNTYYNYLINRFGEKIDCDLILISLNQNILKRMKKWYNNIGGKHNEDIWLWRHNVNSQ
ncbi:MAG: UvrD-helicase domain-containing protein [Mycoplasmatales bacterium]